MIELLEWLIKALRPKLLTLVLVVGIVAVTSVVGAMVWRTGSDGSLSIKAGPSALDWRPGAPKAPADEANKHQGPQAPLARG
jgi:hypothetical protein